MSAAVVERARMLGLLWARDPPGSFDRDDDGPSFLRCSDLKAVGTPAPQRLIAGASKEEMVAYKETLRRLALSDERFLETALRIRDDSVDLSQLDPKTHALVRLGAGLAIDAAPSSYQSIIEVALASGATIDEIVGTLVAVAPTIGLARVVSAAPELALALGYDVDAAFESTDDEQ